MGYFWVSLCIGLAKTQEHNLFTTISTEELSNYESAETILTLNQDRYEYFFNRTRQTALLYLVCPRRKKSL